MKKPRTARWPPVASYCTARIVYIKNGDDRHIENSDPTGYFEKSETIGPWIWNSGFCKAPL
jgi:hypothetical protein